MRATAEIRYDTDVGAIVWVGRRSLHQFWKQMAPYFSGLLLPPNRRTDEGVVSWSWSGPEEPLPPSGAELEALRGRMVEYAETFVENLRRESANDDANDALAAALSAWVSGLIAKSDAELARFVCRTDAGLRLHSWGAAVAAVPHDPDAAGRGVEGAVFIDGRPASEVAVLLCNDSGEVVARETAGSEGRFHFRKVAPGNYRIRAQAEGAGFPEEGYSVAVRREAVGGIELHGATVKGESEARSRGERPARRRRMGTWVALAGGLAVAGIAWALLRAGSGQPAPQSVAVGTTRASGSAASDGQAGAAAPSARFGNAMPSRGAETAGGGNSAESPESGGGAAGGSGSQPPAGSAGLAAETPGGAPNEGRSADRAPDGTDSAAQPEPAPESAAAEEGAAGKGSGEGDRSQPGKGAVSAASEPADASGRQGADSARDGERTPGGPSAEGSVAASAAGSAVVSSTGSGTGGARQSPPASTPQGGAGSSVGPQAPVAAAPAPANTSVATLVAGSDERARVVTTKSPVGRPTARPAAVAFARSRTAPAEASRLSGEPLRRIALPTVRWKLELLRDAILPTEPEASGSPGSIEKLGERIRNQRRAPEGLRRPVIVEGCVLSAVDGIGGGWTWSGPAGSVQEKAGASTAELRWNRVGPPAGSRYELRLRDGGLSAVVTFGPEGAVLEIRPGLNARYLVAVRPGAGPGLEAASGWRTESGGPLPSALRQSAEGPWRRLIAPLNETPGFLPSLMLADETAGWGLVATFGPGSEAGNR